jgi:hypothetical protein
LAIINLFAASQFADQSSFTLIDRKELTAASVLGNSRCDGLPDAGYK